MKSTIEAETTLFDYFHLRVTEAWGELGLDMSDETGLYLSTLLVERARSDAPRPRADTLAELHARASGAPPAVQARTYRELGDRSLYLVGYFEESLSRRTVGPRYYCEMGAAAYHRVDQVFKRWFADAFGRVFAELALGFMQCVQVLKRVRTVVDEEPDVLMRLYNHWLETGSEQAAARLRERGLVLPPRAAGVDEA